VNSRLACLATGLIGLAFVAALIVSKPAQAGQVCLNCFVATPMPGSVATPTPSAGDSRSSRPAWSGSAGSADSAPPPGCTSQPADGDIPVPWLSCVGAQLPGWSFQGADFSYADLTDANIQEIQGNLINLTHANMTHASLRYAQFQFGKLGASTLTDADLTGADMLGADLTRATLTNATLDGIDWDDTTCPDGTNSNSHGFTCTGHLTSEREAGPDQGQPGNICPPTNPNCGVAPRDATPTPAAGDSRGR
jgi:hypothetical protein